MENQLEKAIRIAKKTGDRLIVFDNIKKDSAYVVMSLDEYEKIALKNSNVRGLTENELLDKINRDIAVWKNEQIGEGQSMVGDRDYFTNIKENISYKQDENELYFEDFIKDDKINPIKENKMRNHWVIPDSRKAGAEEIIEEDRQYLEEI